MALPPKASRENIKFYKSILLQEQSARIENIMNRNNSSEVLYHKFIITSFVSYKDWEHPSSLKTLTNLKSLTSSELQYNYYDYMDAFVKVLFFQDKNFDHSWFLMFDKKFSSTVPSWFLKWWEMFGSIPQIFPEPLQDALRYFCSKFQASNDGSQFPAILHMTIMYRIHWISMWNYSINNNLLDREFSIKWWDSFRFNDIITHIHKDFPPPVQRTLK